MSPEETMQALLRKLVESGSGKDEADVENIEKLNSMDANNDDDISVFENISIGCNWVSVFTSKVACLLPHTIWTIMDVFHICRPCY